MKNDNYANRLRFTKQTFHMKQPHYSDRDQKFIYFCHNQTALCVRLFIFIENKRCDNTFRYIDEFYATWKVISDSISY